MRFLLRSRFSKSGVRGKWKHDMVDVADGKEAVAVTLDEKSSEEHLSRIKASFREYRPTCSLHDSYLAHRFVEEVSRQENERHSEQSDEEGEEGGCLCTVHAVLGGTQQACSASSETCDCIGAYGNFYSSIETRSDPILLLDAVPRLHALVECSAECACSSSALTTCANRVVGRGLQVALEIFDSGANMGLGLRTKQSLDKGQFVIEYAGEVISDEEARKRWKAYAADDFTIGNYILAVREHLSEGYILRTNIDPTRIGNAARFVNHSCDPNLVVLPVRVDIPIIFSRPSQAQKQQLKLPSPPRAALFARRDIAAGEPLSFDYGDGMMSQGDGGPLSGSSKQQCFCMAPNCRRWLYTDTEL